MCSTLHRENLSSKYVSEFFGLKDSIYVKRRQGRDREVHICKIDINEYEQYLNHMYEKLAVLYGYNPQNKIVSRDTTRSILEEQLAYEIQEINRLNKINMHANNYTGSIGKMSKTTKIDILRLKLQELDKNINEDRGER
ncbi:hypothetical protein D3C87_1674260 [compost metagenome]